MTWLDDLVNEHKAFEAPLNFWRWAALSAVSAVVKDNLWISRIQFLQYPNIFVLLYADSGLKKGGPIFMAKQLVTKVNNTKIVSGRSSIQGILKKLGTAESRPGGVVINKATGFICASELSSALVKDEAALDILTDLFDRSWNPGNYESLLKQESFNLKDPTITMLGGINEAHAEALFATKDLHGGFIGRSFIIHESKRNAINSLVSETDLEIDTQIDYTKYSDYLQTIALLRGPFKPLTKQTISGRFFDDWYNDLVKNIEKKEIKDPTGTLNRASESVIKISMLLSLIREPNLEIGIKDLEIAIKMYESLVGNMRKTTSAQGEAKYMRQKAEIMNELRTRDNHMISRIQLNKNFWTSANSQDWDLIMESLRDGGWVTFEMVGPNLMYVMPEERAIELNERMKGKN